jgi:hypothetical protein
MKEKWFDELAERLVKLGLEIAVTEGPAGPKVTVAGPDKEPCKEAKEVLWALTPAGIPTEYRRGLLHSTMARMTVGFGRVLKSITNGPGARHVVITLTSEVDPDKIDMVTGAVKDCLSQDKFPESWEVRIGDAQVVYCCPKVAEEWQRNILARKDQRVIQKDDLTNLKITLASAKTVEEFLAAV